MYRVSEWVCFVAIRIIDYEDIGIFKRSLDMEARRKCGTRIADRTYCSVSIKTAKQSC